jgi:hypothetical protein
MRKSVPAKKRKKRPAKVYFELPYCSVMVGVIRLTSGKNAEFTRNQIMSWHRQSVRFCAVLLSSKILVGSVQISALCENS